MQLMAMLLRLRLLLLLLLLRWWRLRRRQRCTWLRRGVQSCTAWNDPDLRTHMYGQHRQQSAGF